MVILDKKVKNKIVINLNPDFNFTFLVIWNYNNELSIGVRECKIFFNDKEIFDGIISQGEGSGSTDYHSVISRNIMVNEDRMNLELKKILETGKTTPVMKGNLSKVLVNEK